MVKGLPKFRDHFREYEQEFVLIGGAACDQWFGARSLQFRATKDLDIVLLVEGLTPSFLRHFWTFVKDGGYQTRERSSGNHEYFRFLRPEQDDYPAKIELFSRQPDGITLFEGQEIVPIVTGEDVSSLSAILMNDDYYNLILDTHETHNELPPSATRLDVPRHLKQFGRPLPTTSLFDLGPGLVGQDSREQGQATVGPLAMRAPGTSTRLIGFCPRTKTRPHAAIKSPPL